MAKVHLVYGFTEGKWHGKKFRRALRRQGFSTTKKLARADYVVAHSGGCYDVPPLADHQVLMLINPTYWPNRSIKERAKNMIKQIFGAIRLNNLPLYHLNKLGHNIWYLFYHPGKNHYMARRAPSFNLEQEIKHRQTILVRNDGDPWLTTDLDDLKKSNPHLQIERLPGEHDDCWLHPEPYIAMLTAYNRNKK